MLNSFSRFLSRATPTTVGAIVVLCAASASHADVSNIIPPKTIAATPGGINVADGSFQYSVTDLAIGTMKLERSYYTSRVRPDNPPFGINFSSNFDIFITAAPHKGTTTPYYPIAHLGGKASGVFSRASTSNSVFPQNLDAERGSLSYTGSQYVYVDGSDASGTIYTFSSTVQASGMTFAANSRRIERIDFPDGRRQTFTYSGTNLKLVEDSAGYAMVFDYDANGDVTAACAFNRSQIYVSATSTCAGATLKTSYGYTSGYLTSVTDALGQVTTYTNTNWGMTCVKPPGFATCTITNSNHSDRIQTQTLQDGGAWTTFGASPDQMNDPEGATFGEDCANTTSITDPNSVITYQAFASTSPCSMTDALGYTTSFVYEGAHQYFDTGPVFSDGTFLREATYPEGNKYQAQYNGPFHAVSLETMVPKPSSGLSSISKTYGYDVCTGTGRSYQNCAKPIWVRDPKGNQTDFTYATHGGLLTEMRPAPTAGASRPLKILTYVQKYAYIKNSGGALVTAATPLWMLSSETQCQTVAGSNTPTCDSGGPQTVTAYQYGADGTADNLLVRGVAVTADGQTRRSCFGYDTYSRKISETKPNAGLGVCP